MTIKQIATHPSVNHNTVGNWIMAWEELGIAGLYRKIGQGRVPILNITSSIHVEALANAVKDNAQNVKIVQAELIEVLKRLFKIAFHGFFWTSAGSSSSR